ncbi:MAG: hypothetical protein U9N84_05495 [Actinomycetota bacterium]|nr:hypothetical protein [Actinomycetota bacterium]
MRLEDRIRSTLEAEAERVEHAPQPVPAAPPLLRWQQGPLLALGVFFAVVAVGSVLFLLRSTPVSPPVAATPPPVETVPPTTAVSPGAETLAAAGLDSAVLYYPTILPAGWALCEEVINPPVARVSFCDPGAGENRITLDVLDASSPSSSDDEPVPGAIGWTMSGDRDELTVHVPVAVSWRLRAHSSGLDLDNVVAILKSVPAIGNRGSLIPTYETPMVVENFSETQLRELFAPEESVQVTRQQDGSFQSVFVIARSDQPDRMSLHAGRATNTDLIDLLGGLPGSQLVTAAERPMVIGGSGETVQAFWIQRGLLWSLTTRVDAELAQSTALALEQAIAATDLTGTANGIEAFQIDGVWVFQHNPEGWDDALHSGTADVVNGCLVVDGTIVIWHIDRIDEAADVIAAINAGGAPQLLIGGGGISLNEGATPDQIPAIIADQCPTSAVWFGAP